MDGYCCKMREKYVLGIIGVNLTVPDPVDVVDYVDFDATRQDGRTVVNIKFCPFCGKAVTGPLRQPPETA